jgi:hypothetical protein
MISGCDWWCYFRHPIADFGVPSLTAEPAGYFTSTSIRIHGWMQHWNRCFPFDRLLMLRRLLCRMRVFATARLANPPAHSATVGTWFELPRTPVPSNRVGMPGTFSFAREIRSGSLRATTRKKAAPSRMPLSSTRPNFRPGVFWIYFLFIAASASCISPRPFFTDGRVCT